MNDHAGTHSILITDSYIMRCRCESYFLRLAYCQHLSLLMKRLRSTGCCTHGVTSWRCFHRRIATSIVCDDSCLRSMHAQGNRTSCSWNLAGSRRRSTRCWSFDDRWCRQTYVGCVLSHVVRVTVTCSTVEENAVTSAAELLDHFGTFPFVIRLAGASVFHENLLSLFKCASRGAMMTVELGFHAAVALT